MKKEFICKKCGGTEYYLEKDGHRRCKECTRAKMRAIYASEAYKNKHRADDRRRRRNCTAEQYERSLAEQDGKCAICGKKCDGELRADHDHSSGKFRALLCDSCNWGLGNFKDDINLLQNAIRYLEQHKD